MAKSRTIPALRKELAAKEKQLSRLLAQREKLAVSLAAVESQIDDLSGAQSAVKAGRKPKTTAKKTAKKRKSAPKAKKTVAKAPKKSATRAKRTGKKTLIQYITAVLSKSPKGVHTKDIVDAIIKAGCPVTGKNFYNSIAATLSASNLVKRIERGVYTLR